MNRRSLRAAATTKAKARAPARVPARANGKAASHNFRSLRRSSRAVKLTTVRASCSLILVCRLFLRRLKFRLPTTVATSCVRWTRASWKRASSANRSHKKRRLFLTKTDHSQRVVATIGKRSWQEFTKRLRQKVSTEQLPMILNPPIYEVSALPH